MLLFGTQSTISIRFVMQANQFVIFTEVFDWGKLGRRHGSHESATTSPDQRLRRPWGPGCPTVARAARRMAHNEPVYGG